MGWKRRLLATWAAAEYARQKTAQQVRRTFALLQTIQVLLLVAITILVGTVLVSVVQPAWTPYAYGIGAVVLAVPLVAILVLVWKPLHNAKVRRAQRWAERTPEKGLAGMLASALRRH